MIFISQKHLKPFSVPRPCLKVHGFSLTEIIVTISMLSILAGIALVLLNGAFGKSKEILAVNRLEMVNKALSSYTTNKKETVYSPRLASSDDENLILMALRYRNQNDDLATVGSPFIDPDYNPKASSDPNLFRMRWVGTRFELLRPGTVGTGVSIPFDGSDMGGNPPTIDPEKVFGK